MTMNLQLLQEGMETPKNSFMISGSFPWAKYSIECSGISLQQRYFLWLGMQINVHCQRPLQNGSKRKYEYMVHVVGCILMTLKRKMVPNAYGVSLARPNTFSASYGLTSLHVSWGRGLKWRWNVVIRFKDSLKNLIVKPSVIYKNTIRIHVIFIIK
jgi:hypothetical protein